MHSGVKCDLCFSYSTSKVGDFFLVAPCKHIFHNSCIRDQYISRGSEGGQCCPLDQVKLSGRATPLNEISRQVTHFPRILPNIKIVVIGEPNIGKSSLLFQYLEGTFSKSIASTVAFDINFKVVEIAGELVKLRLWDCAGQERFQAFTPNLMRGAHGVFVVYDITNSHSFNKLGRWFRFAESYAPENVSMILVGNKSDNADARQVSTEKGKAKADSLGIYFMETSAKEGHNVDAAFRLLAATAFEKLQTHDESLFQKESKGSFTLTPDFVELREGWLVGNSHKKRSQCKC